MKEHIKTDILIVGAGIVGLAVARAFTLKHPQLKIIIIDKEPRLAEHASGRNSGVIHAGFYYSPDSLKAKLTLEGNRLLTQYCLKNNIAINRCGKVVVAKNEDELKSLDELKRRGEKNGVPLEMVNEAELTKIEPNARTYKKALYSPSTSTVNPREVVEQVAKDLKNKADIFLNEPFLKRDGASAVLTRTKRISYNHLINTAGLYADKVGHEFGVGLKYTLIPFKGLYMEYKDHSLIKKHIYPVPDSRNPFLGVHFTCTVDGHVKIGPTAIPAFWRENYKGFDNFKLNEIFHILFNEARLFISNSFNFRALALEETKKFYGEYMKKQSALLVKKIDISLFGGYLKPGIRAQLINTEDMSIVMDFVVEHAENSTHVLNAVSPAFTCAFSFGNFVVDKVAEKFIIG
ncbi:L-2-hydroxyglutarate oxidase [bacterium]|nr:MAG: L-2-hydroxyglutarate oxidase [bacterium]